ncbi:MAG: dTMP kinase [Gammaproteobacteria bacterium]|nr:dTMP kinase [Gammaproteobacteria bacterium]
MTERGRFITLEGIEGVGKSTQTAMLVEWLRSKGVEAVATREPGGTPVAESIRGLLKDTAMEGMSAETELLLMFAARAEHARHLIRPALKAGRWVVCDRFVDASYAYQGRARGLGETAVRTLAEWLVQDLEPDITLWLDMPVPDTLERIGLRGGKDRFESEGAEFFSRVRDGYRECLQRAPERVRCIAAEGSLDEVQSRCREAVGPFLPATQ